MYLFRRLTERAGSRRFAGWAWGLGLLLAATPAAAWAVELSDVVRALEAPFQAKTLEGLKIHDYAADFNQQARIASLDRLQRANGQVEVAFSYPDPQKAPEVRFRWQYQQPSGQEIVSDGRTLWVYLPENNQVIVSQIDKSSQDRQADPMTFITGLGNLSRDFQIDWAEPGQNADGNYVLALTPRQASPIISRLEIVVDRTAVLASGKPEQPGDPAKARFPLSSATVIDPNDNSTLIEFINLRVNHGIPEKTFAFVIPEGVEVLRPTDRAMGF